MTYRYDLDESPGTVTRGSKGSRLGNVLIAIAGADRTELDERSVDRSYYIGMGSGLLMTATISTLSMSEATSIAFGVRFGSEPLILAGIVYFLLILGLDRWLVSDQTTGFARKASGNLTATAEWLRHFIVELFKISPRIAVALVSSLLFAKFLLLAIYSPEIHQQLAKMEQQQLAQYDVQLQGVGQNIITQAQGVISKADAAEAGLETQYNNGRTAISNAYKQMETGIEAANKAGIYCSEQPTYSVATNPNTGLEYSVISGEYQVCPPPISGYQANYQNVVNQYPATQAQVTAAQNKVAASYGVPAAEHAIKTASATAKQEMGPYKPKEEDGLLAREHALELLTTPPAGTCPPQPSEADIASIPACTSMYSAGAASEMELLRYFLLAFEMLPVTMKFINSLLPKRAYAWAMTAREAERRDAAKTKIGKTRQKAETDLATFMRREQARLEEEGALQEYKLRELARQERRLGLRRIRSRFTAALVDSEPSRVLRDFVSSRRKPDTNPDNVISMASYVDPRNTHADPGIGVIDSEDFLY